MAGPETPLATRGFDVEGAIESATAPGMAIVGASDTTDTSTRRTPDVPMADPAAGGRQFSVDIESPGYGWRLSPDDLGQGQVQQIRTDNFVTPVAEMKLPFGAIAARQQYVAERRNSIEQAKRATAKAFDPFAGIGDPAAQHQAAFGKYTVNTWWPSLVKDAAQATGLNEKEAVAWMYETPEGNAYVKRNSQILDRAAKESAGMTDRMADLLEKHQKGEVTLFPEDMKLVNDWMQGRDHQGLPVSGKRLEDFMWENRDVEGMMAFGYFGKDFLKGFDEYAMQKIQQGAKGRHVGGGRYEISDEEKSLFDDYKEAMTQVALEQGVLNGDEKEIRRRLDLLIKDKVKYTTRGWEVNKGSSSDKEGGATGPQSEVSVVRTPKADGTVSERVVISPWQVTGGKPHKVAKAAFNTAKGSSVDLYAPALTWDDKGLFYIEGINLNKSDIEKVNQEFSAKTERGKLSDRTDDDSVKVEFILSNKIGKREKYAAANNGGEMNKLWGSKDPYEIIAMKLREQGEQVTADEIRAAWKDPAVRKGITESLK